MKTGQDPDELVALVFETASCAGCLAKSTVRSCSLARATRLRSPTHAVRLGAWGFGFKLQRIFACEVHRERMNHSGVWCVK